jgi:glycyl-tRNA synthetase beta chain
VRGVLSLLDGEVLPLALGEIEASGQTAGHPVLSPEPFPVKSFAHYSEQLAERGIEVGWRRRAERLREGLAERARELKGSIEIPNDLLHRLAGRCEIPGALGGAFDPDHLSLPEEILCATLEGHLALPLRDKDSEILPLFVTAIDRADDPDGLVRAGHERALSGHLADARFHYEADRARTMVERARQLDQHTFHPGLGTWAEKTERVRDLAQLIAREAGLEEHLEAIQQAAGLLKADLTTDTVRRLPQLRGTLGGIYARLEGYVEAVWRAISEHYQPGGGDAPIPSQAAGRVLALADRLDSLVGFLGLGLLPHGRKDPYALRSLARGLLRILIEGGFELDLDLVGARAVLLYGDALERGAEEILTDLQVFLGARLEHLLGHRGFTFDEIAAARAVGHSNLPDLVARIEALRTVREEADFRSLVLAAKRISNLVDGLGDEPFDEDLLVEEAERELAEALAAVRGEVDRAVAEHRYADGLRHIEALVPALDRFFAEVLVMDENPSRRTNRIALLQRCRRTFWRVARLKEMVIDRESPAPPADSEAARD